MIAIKISEPIGNIAHIGVGVAIFILKAIVAGYAKANMIDAIENCIDQILAEKHGAGPIILHEVKTCFRTVFVVTVVRKKRECSRLISLNPLVDPAHLAAAQAGVVTVGLS